MLFHISSVAASGTSADTLTCSQKLCECKNGRSITSDFRVPFQSTAFLVCLKQISMRRRALCKNLNSFTSNYAVISLPEFLRDEIRDLNET